MGIAIRAVRMALMCAVFAYAFVPDCAAIGPADIEAAIERHANGTQLALGQRMPPLVSFPGPRGALNGYLYRPSGDGPFPAMLWNHGSEKLAGWQPELAAFYNRQGFVFFLPHRAGQGRSPGSYVLDCQQELSARSSSRDLLNLDIVRLHEEASEEVAAAVAWLKRQSFVDPTRIVMSGVSFGGIQTLLAAERDDGVCAFVAFAPAAMSWANTRLRDRLVRAVRTAAAPVFLVQAANDYNLGPSEVLGPEVRAKNPLNRAVVYPSFGKTPAHGHGAFAVWDIGTEIWGPDVITFIQSIWAAR